MTPGDIWLAWALLAVAAVQVAGRALGWPSLAARLVPRMAGRAPYGVWAVRLWIALGLPALGALLLIGRGGAIWTLPAEFAPVAASARAWGVVSPGPVLLGLASGLLLGAVLTWWRLRRGRGLIEIGRPPRLPRAYDELPAAALLAITAGVAEEMYFRLALPLLIAIVCGSAWLGFGLAAAAFGAVHRYQGPVGMAVTGAVALLLSAVYLASGSLWLAMACHAAIDLNALVIRPWLAMRAGRAA
ncbi:CPBP family intramembrane glutamic endopeptidase [uncultured Sphingomonas sp.]|uniref:CPBP family intramembrane glutamic endopeptidase n=1 Tax=uncultured Sphingomonas sp. TaxID=158754 RepID=UPI0035CC60D0